MEVWCLKCKGHGHNKDHCPVYQNYLIGGGPIPLKLENTVGMTASVVLWCTIYQIIGKHTMENCHFLHKFVQTPQQLFYIFCKFVGHEVHNYRSYELMMKRNSKYRVHMEACPQYDQGTTKAQGGFQGRGRG